jgi:hypothetical protein
MQKHMEEFDETSTSGVDVVAELSPPCRQYKEDHQAKCKAQGCKWEKNQHRVKRVNWKTPFLWSQIETAAARAGKPWKPCTILQEVQKVDPICFRWLTEQVIGHWIDQSVKSQGISKWSDLVMARVKVGNSLHSTSTQKGVLVHSAFHLTVLSMY